LFGDDTLNNNKNKNDPEKVSSSKPKALKAKSKQKRFAVAEELKQLRADLDALRENVHWAEAMEDADRVADLKRAIQNGEERDPDLCYAKALQILAQTKATSLTTNKDLSSTEKQRLLVKWQKEAELARSCLPQFQLEGLWVGK
jgi:anti-sigma28 factor (negative regulator of flagellin synthesis)